MDLAPRVSPRLPECKIARRESLFFLVILAGSLFAVLHPLKAADKNQGQPGADFILWQSADERFKQGDYEAALDYLKNLRQEYPASQWIDQSLWLSAQITFKAGETYKTRYFLKKIMAESYNKLIVVEAVVMLADIFYKERVFEEALNYYKSAVKLAGKLDKGIIFPLERVYLKLADLTYYQKKDVNLARYYFNLIKKAFTGKEEAAVYNLLKRKLAWESITPEAIGVEDGNISAITVDGDDLWIGTWNGGVVRYSFSTGKIKLFKEGMNSIADNAIRAIEAEKKRVWVGTYNGLSVYTKTDSSWKTIEKFGTASPGKIAVIKTIGDAVYAGTLGNGLWKYSSNSWKRVGSRESPGDYILCLQDSGKTLYIGTMTNGIFLLDKAGGTLKNFDTLVPEFTPRNITMLLEDKHRRLWIGTYGEGLVQWNKSGNTLRYFNKKSGEIRDDWVLCGAETERGVYLGTFGGGVAFFAFKDSAWKNLGIQDGLTSMDIATMAYSKPVLYFGTLGAGIAVYKEKFYDQEL